MSKCGEKTEVYSRVCGYFRPVSNWNKGKKEEYKERTKFVVPIIILGLCFMLAGCGHNAVQYSDGVGLEIGFIPEQYSVSMNFRYGKIFSAVVKEKSKVNLVSEVANKAQVGGTDNKSGASDLGTKTTLTLETGDQVTGYAVDLEEVKAAAVKKD